MPSICIFVVSKITEVFQSAVMSTLLLHVPFVLLLVTFSSCFGFSVVCPQQETISPCSCKHVAFGLHVVCENLNTTTTLQNAFRVLRDYEIDNLVLHGLRFQQSVPDDVFVGLKVVGLRLQESHLGFAGPAFQGLESSLTYLNVAKCSVRGGIKNFRLSKLKKLIELNVQLEHLERVDDDWLKDSTPNLQIVFLDHNEITEIEESAFSTLSQLRKISLADNRLTLISRKMFPIPSPKLTRIDLSDNELQSLPRDMFAEMPNLEAVILSGNELQTMPEKTWAEIWDALSTVLLYENSLICDERLHWMKGRRRPSSLEGTCAAPEKMIGKSLEEVLTS